MFQKRNNKVVVFEDTRTARQKKCKTIYSTAVFLSTKFKPL